MNTEFKPILKHHETVKPKKTESFPEKLSKLPEVLLDKIKLLTGEEMSTHLSLRFWTFGSALSVFMMISGYFDNDPMRSLFFFFPCVMTTSLVLDDYSRIKKRRKA